MFMYFCIKSCIGTQVKLASCKSALNPQVVCFMSYLGYFVLVFFSPFSLAITSLGEERANRCFSYVCSICACLVLSVSSSS